MANCIVPITVQGVLAKLGFALSDTTTPPTDPTEQLEFDRHTYSRTVQYEDTSGIRGTEAMPVETYVQLSRMASGGFDCRPKALDVERWLPRIMGGTYGSTTAGLKSLNMAEIRPCFDAFALIGGKGYKYRQQRVQSATFSATERQPMQLSVQTVGTDRDDPITDPYTWPSLTYTAGAPFLFPQLQITIAGTAYLIYRFSLTIQYGIEAQYLNSYTPTAFPSSGSRDVSLSLQFPGVPSVALTSLFYATPQPVTLTMDFGTGAARRTLIFSAPKCVPAELRDLNVQNKGPQPWDLNLKMAYDTTSGPDTQLTASIRSAGDS